jgi:hypothetical protein
MPIGQWRNEFERAVMEGVNTLIRDFQAAPYSFLSKSDLQATLLIELRSRIRGRPQIPNLTQGPLSLIYSDYHHGIDIVCLDPEPASYAATKPGGEAYIYHLPILVGIKIGYLRMGDDFPFSACLSDFERLLRLEISCPLVLCFVQDNEAADDLLSDRFAPSKRTPLPVEEANDFRRIYVATPKDLWSITES